MKINKIKKKYLVKDLTFPKTKERLKPSNRSF